MTRDTSRIVARSAAMKAALELCKLYARFRRPVVFVGPVGAGKTSLAKELFRAATCAGSFVAVSSGELGETLYADTLFGHVSGAYTGAASSRQGVLSEAANGVLLLDDLALMPVQAQAAILRVMETGRYRPLGGSEDRGASCRFAFATTTEPHHLVKSGRLLEDLEGRLGQLFVPVPPLKDRKDDILPIAESCAQAIIDEHELDAMPVFGSNVQELLLSYHWPGNVRELRDVVERAVVHAGARDGRVEVHTAHLPQRLRDFRADTTERGTVLTMELIEATLRRVGGNRSEAARQLGVHRNTIARRLQAG